MIISDEDKKYSYYDEFILGDKDVVRKFINYMYPAISKLDNKERECIEDYFVSEMSSRELTVSFVSSFVFIIMLL